MSLRGKDGRAICHRCAGIPTPVVFFEKSEDGHDAYIDTGVFWRCCGCTWVVTPGEMRQWCEEYLKMRRKDEDHASALCTGHRAGRPTCERKVEVNCPSCNVTIDTMPMPTVLCPNCDTLFARISGNIIPRIDGG